MKFKMATKTSPLHLLASSTQQMIGRRTLLLLALPAVVSAFAPGQGTRKTRIVTTHRVSSLFAPQRETWAPSSTFLYSSNSPSDEDPTETCWNPKLRRTMGTVASLGAIETAYLTFSKLTGGGNLEQFCGVSGDCGSVLSGPYSWIPGTDIPLAAVGLLAYTVIAALALGPILQNQTDDSDNRVQLTALSTAMGVFSAFLMALLFGVLKQSCAFCIASATFSIGLAKLAWLGGALPKERVKEGVAWSAGSALAAFAASVVIFAAPDASSAVNVAGELAGGSATSLVLADASPLPPQAAPPISTTSSSRALELSTNLQALNAKMYGAYWCSHCFEQKERLGKEAMAKIPYIECSADGVNSQNAMCKERKLPGYPTWEINGKLYPGDQELDELEEIVQKFK
jgi:uncharacterized membrane protein